MIYIEISELAGSSSSNSSSNSSNSNRKDGERLSCRQKTKQWRCRNNRMSMLRARLVFTSILRNLERDIFPDSTLPTNQWKKIKETSVWFLAYPRSFPTKTSETAGEPQSAPSILVLGVPGSGKTTAIRDICRKLSATQVCVCVLRPTALLVDVLADVLTLSNMSVCNVETHVTRTYSLGFDRCMTVCGEFGGGMTLLPQGGAHQQFDVPCGA